MGKFIKSGRVVVLLTGRCARFAAGARGAIAFVRFAGKKAVVVKPYDDGSKTRPFPHALVAGVAKAPTKVTKNMSKIQASCRTIRAWMTTQQPSHGPT